MYEKIVDDSFDRGRRVPKFLRKRFDAAYQKASLRLRASNIDTFFISDLMCRQRELENQGNCSMERLSEQSGAMLQYIFRNIGAMSPNDPDGSKTGGIGYHVGKWIYIMDSIVDFENDIIARHFNPLALRCGSSRDKIRIHMLPKPLADEISDLLWFEYSQIKNGVEKIPALKNSRLLNLLLIDNINLKNDAAEKALYNKDKETRHRFKILRTATAPLLAPTLAFAAGNSNYGLGTCLGPIAVCGILLFALNKMSRGNCNVLKCIPGVRGPQTMNVKDGCGRNRRYRRGCDGQYREDNRCC
jgi:hypothetical protein